MCFPSSFKNKFIVDFIRGMIGGAFAHVERPAKKQRNSIAITPGGRYFPLVGSGRLTF